MLGKGYQMTGRETAKKIFGVASEQREEDKETQWQFWKEEFSKEKVI